MIPYIFPKHKCSVNVIDLSDTALNATKTKTNFWKFLSFHCHSPQVMQPILKKWFELYPLQWRRFGYSFWKNTRWQVMFTRWKQTCQMCEWEELVSLPNSMVGISNGWNFKQLKFFQLIKNYSPMVEFSIN